jgi:hypothetical protein
MVSGRIVLSVLLLALLVSSRPALAVPPVPPVAEPPGRVYFTRGTELWVVSGAGDGARLVAALPDTLGAIVALDASPDGGLVVARGDRGSKWLVMGETTWRGECPGRARPGATNDYVICEESGKISVLGARYPGSFTIPMPARDAAFLGGVTQVAALTDNGVLAYDLLQPAKKRLLAKPGAAGWLLVSPDGDKAVAVFDTGPASRVRGFALDGTGVPRNLGGPGVPVVWSWDSTWVLIDAGAPPEHLTPEDDEGSEDGSDEGGASLDVGRGLLAAPGEVLLAAKKKGKKKKAVREEPPAKIRTCVVRAVGGESKCWNHFSGRGFAPSCDKALLWRDGSLWIGKIPGVRPDPPRRLVEQADGPAVWVR